MRAIRSNMKDQILTNDKKILHCIGCDSEFSGNSGDYWYLPEDHIFTCSHCEIELELVNKTTSISYR